MEGSRPQFSLRITSATQSPRQTIGPSAGHELLCALRRARRKKMTRPLEKPKNCGKHNPNVLAGWLLRRVSGQA
jgi:hypothetical protein